MNYTPDQVRAYGLEPYAVYGGKVASFKCEGVERIFDIAMLPEILAAAQKAANKQIDEINQ